MRRRPTFVDFLDRHVAYVLILPTVICMLVVNLYPLLDAFAISFQHATLTAPVPTFDGLANYREVLQDPHIRGAFGLSVLSTVISVAASFAIGLLLALILHQPLPGRGIIRGAFIVPWAMPAFVAALVWGWMYNDQFGVFSGVLRDLGMRPPIWLDQSHAFPSLIAVMIWKSFPFQLVILLAGLQALPGDLYEAAAVDGAGVLHRFLRITLPLMRPVAMIAVLLAIIETFQTFPIPYLLTDGGPSYATYTVPIAVYTEAFSTGNLGYGEAAAVLMFLFLLIAAIVYLVFYLREVRDL